RADVGADLYALGVMLHEALTGHLPHGSPPGDLARRRVLEPVPPLADSAPEVPAPIAALVDAMLPRHPTVLPSPSARLGAALAGGAICLGAEEIPLLGRTDLVSALVKTARAGRGALVVGGPGTGKTRLLHVLAQRLAAEGHVVHRLGRSERPLGSLRRFL